jgi:hypothetical protein
MREIIKLKARKVDYATAGNDPERWQAVSSHLLATAQLVWQPIAEGITGYRNTRDTVRTPAQTAALEARVRYRGPFFLLAGLAVENQLKALIVRRAIATNPSCTTRDILQQFPKKNHDLVQLAARAGVVLTNGEERLLERLAHWIRWAGRYPIPKHEPDTAFERTTRECDLEDIERLIRKVDNRIRQLQKS